MSHEETFIFFLDGVVVELPQILHYRIFCKRCNLTLFQKHEKFPPRVRVNTDTIIVEWCKEGRSSRMYHEGRARDCDEEIVGNVLNV